MQAVLVGAGFSKCAAGLPLAAALFDFDIDPRTITEENRLKRLRDDKAKWDAANPEGGAEQFIAWSLRKSTLRRKRITWYVARRLSVPFQDHRVNGAQTFMIDESYVQTLSEVARTKSILSPLIGETSGVITTNYDMLLEYALGTKLFNYGRRGEHLTGRGHNPAFPWQNTPVVLTGRIPIAKIHGSVSWNASSRFTDGRCGLKGDALIVPPYPDKTGSELLPETWALARSILTSADRVYIFGLALNDYDSDLRNLLTSTAGTIKQVIIVDPRPNIEGASKIWPNANILPKGPPSHCA